MVCINYSWPFAVSFVSLSCYALACDNENQQRGFHSSLVYALLCDGERFEVFSFEKGKSAQPVFSQDLFPSPDTNPTRHLRIEIFGSVSNADFSIITFSYLPIRLQSKLICLTHKKITVRVVGKLLIHLLACWPITGAKAATSNR